MLSFIELFAGCGLLSHAFIEVGFHPVVAVEVDPVACESYATNVGDHIVNIDVRSFSTKKKCDVLIAGPPCQGFSTLNRSRSNDVRNDLVFEVCRVVGQCRPSLVLIENVAPFKNSIEFSQTVKRLEHLGYDCQAKVVDALEFGTAQSRKRCILVASKIAGYSFPKGRDRATTVLQAWRDLPNVKRDPFGNVFPIPSALALKRMRKIPLGGDRRDIPSNLAPRSWRTLNANENTGVWGRLDWDSFAPTIRTSFQNPSKGRHIHPELNRVITLREGARLQDIPDNWQFFGKRTQITRQIGNGVPIKLGRALAKSCLECLR